MIVHAISVLEDNYAYACEQDGECWIVDPGQAAPIMQWVERNKMRIKGFLVTHHHWDHMGGLKDLYQPHHQVFADFQLDFPHQEVSDGDVISLFEGVDATCMHLPGHTMGALALLVGDCLFTGDVLFGGGIGRIFEGQPEDMYQSLSKILTLPNETKIYFGHEYTLANLKFALAVEPDNEALVERYTKASEATMTTPSMLALEKQTNPFLRLDQASVKQAIEGWSKQSQMSAAEYLGQLRAWKNAYDAGSL